jgi:hypothetical protein
MPEYVDLADLPESVRQAAAAVLGRLPDAEPPVPAPAPPAPAPAPAPPAPAPAPPVPQLETPSPQPATPEVDDRLAAVQHLEQTQKVPAGSAAQYREYLTRQAAYQAKWEEAHPDEEFDINETEHAAFLRRNYPRGLDPAILDRAEQDLRVERLVEARVNRVRQEYAETQINQRAEVEAQQVVQGLRRAEDDQVTAYFAEEAAPAAAAYAREATRVFSGAVAPDPRNPAHAYLLGLAAQASPQLLQHDIRDRSGRRVIPAETFARVPEEQRGAYVPLTQAPDIMSGLVAVQMRSVIEQKAAALRQRVPVSAAPPLPPAPTTPPAPSPTPAAPAPSLAASPEHNPYFNHFV